MSQSLRSILLWVLLLATAALPFAAFGADPVLVVVLPAALACGWLGWHMVRAARICENELNARLARWYARQAVRLMQRVVR